MGGDIDKERDREGDIEGEKKESRPAGADHPSTGGAQFDLLPTPSPEPDLCEQALEAFNRTVDFVNQNHSAEWRPCRMLTDKRRQHLTKRLKECHGLVGWIEAMRKAVASKYLLGKTARPAEYADWRPNIDFFLQPSSFAKLLEGHYDDRIRQGSAIDRATARAARNFASSGIDPGGPDFRFEAPDVADRAA